MIEIFQGRIGGGKTYAAVARIADHLRRGGMVYTNIEINLNGMAVLLAKKYGVFFQPDFLCVLDPVFGWQDRVEWGTAELDLLVVIDEAQVFYNSRDWAKTAKDHSRMLSFLTQSRKACVSVIFITQHEANIDKQFRLLAQAIWSFRDLAKFPPMAWLFGNRFLAVQTDYAGEKMGSKMVAKDKLIFRAYDTFSFLDDQMRAEAENKRVGIPPVRLKRVGFFKRIFGRKFLTAPAE